MPYKIKPGSDDVVITDQELLAFVKAQARQGKRWDALSQLLNDDYKLEKRLIDKRAELDAIEKKAGTVVGLAKAEADKWRDEAENQCKKVIEDAEKDAAKIVSDAQARAQDSVDKANKEINQLAGRASGIAEEIAAAEKNLKAVSDAFIEVDKNRTRVANDVAALEKRKSDLTAEIDALKQRFA